MQVSSINNGAYTDYCQSKMSLLVIDINYLEGKDGELVVKELATATLITGSLRMCLKDPTVGKICQCLTLD